MMVVRYTTVPAQHSFKGFGFYLVGNKAGGDSEFTLRHPSECTWIVPYEDNPEYDD